MSDVDCFQELESGLMKFGLVEDARWLRQTRTSGFTSSSEMFGEIGAMVRRIHRQIPPHAVDVLSEIFADCERLVQQAWPSFTLEINS